MKRINGDAQLLQLRKSIAEVVQELVMGPKQTPNIRRALLQDIVNGCGDRLSFIAASSENLGAVDSYVFLAPVIRPFLRATCVSCFREGSASCLKPPVSRQARNGNPSAASDPPLPMNSLGVSSSAMPWVNPLSTSIALEDATSQTDLSGFPSFARASIPDSGWRPRGVLVAHLQEHLSAVNDIAISADHSFFVSASDDSTVKIWDSRKLEKDISFRSKLTYHMEGSRVLCATMLPGSAQVIIGASDGFIHMFSVDHISRGLGNVVEKYSGIADITKKDIRKVPYSTF
ncbi:hypothetical protein JHK82_043333 [Glycine max]|nr:hypothetical protein JHK82_043333 [Glycine max]